MQHLQGDLPSGSIASVLPLSRLRSKHGLSLEILRARGLGMTGC